MRVKTTTSRIHLNELVVTHIDLDLPRTNLILLVALVVRVNSRVLYNNCYQYTVTLFT